MNHKRLLIVDDESIFLRALRKMLQAPDVDVDTAETLADARVLLRRHAYNVVIADLRLAGTEGEEGLDIVRAVKENSPRTKVILMTAYGGNEVRLKASFLGADLYLEKPVSIEVIRKSLENLDDNGEEVN
jgi:DNA-binding NtrC family response regulator